MDKKPEQETPVAPPTPLPDGAMELVLQFVSLLSKDATTFFGQLKALEGPVRQALIPLFQTHLRTVVQVNPPPTPKEKSDLAKSLNKLMSVL